MKDDIYVLAHEIRNPLCVVKGYLDMLNDDELLEITPKSIRMRKITLDHTLRGRQDFHKKNDK